MAYSNGKTQKISSRFGSCSSKDKSERLGVLSSQSKRDGVESVRTDKTDCSRENTVRARTKQPRSFGEVLERLNLVEEAFIAYVEEHQEELSAELEKSEAKKTYFLELVDELRNNLDEAISEEEEKTD